MGIVGAVLLIAGAAISGVGFLNLAAATSSETSCEVNPGPGGCGSQSEAVLNASATESLFFGVGLILGGVGAGCVMMAAIGFMSRWPPAPPPAYPTYITPPLSPPPTGP